MTHVNDSFQGYQHFEFSYIKDLAEPSRKLADDEDKKAKKVKKKRGEESGKTGDQDE